MSAANIPPHVTAGDFVYRQPPVPVFTAADGCYLFDDDDNAYIDAEAANGSAVLGYDRDLLAKVAERAAMLPSSPSFAESAPRISLASRIDRLIRPITRSVGRVSFEVGGAQAVEQAMRVVASNRPRARTVVVLRGGYHGRTPFTGELGTSARYRQLLSGSNFHVVTLPVPPDFFESDAAAVEAYLAASTRVGTDDLYGAPVGGGIAAFIFEPLLNVGGMILPADGVLRTLVEHFRSQGALIVADEIFTGLYRTGPVLGIERHGVEPDIVVLSKALTNGLVPLGVVWAREPLMDVEHFPPGTHSSTFGGSQLALAAAHAVLDRLDERPTETVAELHQSLRGVLKPLREATLVRRVDVVGAVARIELRRPLASAVRSAALTAGHDRTASTGTLVASTGLAPHVVALHPPFTIDPAALSDAAQHVVTALETVT